MFNALEKCPSVVLKKHDHFRRMIENRVPTVPEKQIDKINPTRAWTANPCVRLRL